MKTHIKSDVLTNNSRILARQLARELTKEELRLVSGGLGSRQPSSSSDLTCAPCGGVDGGADD